MSPAHASVAVTIRPEAPGDEVAVRAVVNAAFAPKTHEALIVDALRDSDRWIPELALVAEDADGRIVGQCVTSLADLVADDESAGWILALGPIAVEPALQGRDIGGALLRASFAIATDAGWPAIVLLGHADYYPRFGFEAARPLGLLPQQPWSDAHWLVRRLPGWTPALRGTVRFPAAFGTD